MKKIILIFALFISCRLNADENCTVYHNCIELKDMVLPLISYQAVPFPGKKYGLSLYFKDGYLSLPFLPDSLDSILVGQFPITVNVDGYERFNDTLNNLDSDGKEMAFRNNFKEFIFKDYNGDGIPDFTVCKPNGSPFSFSLCTIFTFGENGVLLKISDPLNVGTRSFSTEDIEQVDKTTIRTSDWHAGGGSFHYYKWNGKLFEQIKTERQ